jgi:hypothetical protein
MKTNKKRILKKKKDNKEIIIPFLNNSAYGVFYHLIKKL